MEETHVQKPVRSERWVILAIIVMFLVTVPGLFALPANWILFNPDVYKQELNTQEIYQRFPLLVGETLANSGNNLLPGSGETLLAVLQQANYQQLIRLIFPESWVRAQTESLIDQLFAYLNFKTPEFHLLVDFRSVKERIQGEQELQIVQTIVQGLPVCTQQDILNFAQQALQGKLDNLPLCRPPDMLLGLANSLVTSILRASVSAVPDQLDLANVLPMGIVGANSAFQNIFPIYHAFRQIGPWLPLVSLLLLTIILWLSLRTSRGPLFWTGLALMLPGFVALVVTLLLTLWSNQIAPFLISQIFFSKLAIFDMLVRLLQQVGNHFLLWTGIISLVLTLMGIGFILWWLYRLRHPSAQPG